MIGNGILHTLLGANRGDVKQLSESTAGYHCDWTDPRTGEVQTVDGPCPPAKANQGWVTFFD